MIHGSRKTHRNIPCQWEGGLPANSVHSFLKFKEEIQIQKNKLLIFEPIVGQLYRRNWIFFSNHFKGFRLQGQNHKVHKFWEGQKNMTKSPNFFWRYQVISIFFWRFRQNLVAFSGNMNFKIRNCDSCLNSTAA